MSEASPSWQIVGPFMKFGAVVGLHICINGQQSALHFSSIHNRLEAQWAANEEELDNLWEWWSAPETSHDDANTRIYAERNEFCLAERRQLERLWLEVRGYIPQQAVQA